MDSQNLIDNFVYPALCELHDVFRSPNSTHNKIQFSK